MTAHPAETRVVYCARCAGTGEYPPTGGVPCSWCGGTGEYAETVPLGWVEVAVLLKGKYEVREKDDGWHVYVYDEQTAAHLDGPAHNPEHCGCEAEIACLCPCWTCNPPAPIDGGRDA